MSLLTSLYSGTSGLQANSLELSVVGDNLANAGTVGFKAGRAAFEDALAQSLIGGSGGVGLGTRLQAVQRLITQGALTATGVSTDLALQGAGYFLVQGAHQGREGAFYTRAGQFTVDSTGLLVNLQGLRVQGYVATPDGRITGQLGDLQVGDAASAPRPTSEVTVKANLQADAPLHLAFDPTSPSTTSNFSTSVTVYDSLGAARQVDVYYRRTGDGTWTWHAMTDGGNVAGGTAGTPVEVATGDLTFDTDGRLVGQTQSSNFQPAGATAPQPLTFDFGTGGEGLTQFASASSATFLNQDGHGAGQLASVSIDQHGNVVGAFTNGETRLLAQLAVADFSAPDQLERAGGNMYAQTVASGEPTVGAAGQGGRGFVVAGALEQSNVDMASEFVRMIAAQRGFQANSKTITTADALLGELMQLKR